MKFLNEKHCKIDNIKPNSEILHLKIEKVKTNNIDNSIQKMNIYKYILKLSKNKKEDIKSEL